MSLATNIASCRNVVLATIAAPEHAREFFGVVSSGAALRTARQRGAHALGSAMGPACQAFSLVGLFR